MDAPDRPHWFIGDLADPWVAAIADALPATVRRVPCDGELPDDCPGGPTGPGTVVLHRPILSTRDADWLARLRTLRKPPPRVILCIGPHVRHAELERWSSLYDVVLPEATASETVARHLAGRDEILRPATPRPHVSIVSTDFELRNVLADACEAAGYAAMRAHDWSEAHRWGLAVWEVPVLESAWARVLEERTKVGVVVALFAFPDRVLVSQARAAGASACLELPCDLTDLIQALDRVSAPRPELAHEVPPPPALLRRSVRPVAEAQSGPYNSSGRSDAPEERSDPGQLASRVIEDRMRAADDLGSPR